MPHWLVTTVEFILPLLLPFINLKQRISLKFKQRALYCLPFGQMSFWGATVITNLLSAIPIFGHDLVESNYYII